jgi:hypothetical protein
MGRQAIPFAWRPRRVFRAVRGSQIARAAATDAGKCQERADFGTFWALPPYRFKAVWPALRIDPLTSFA